MAEQAETKTETTKPTRADEVRNERRRKPGNTVQAGVRLTVDESKLDRQNYEYRWVNDDGARMSRMHSEDWDPAPEGAVTDSHSAGTVGAKLAGTDKEGKPMNAVLMRKRKDWYRDDQKEKQDGLNVTEHGIKTGTAHQSTGEPALNEGVYTPDGGNKIDG